MHTRSKIWSTRLSAALALLCGVHAAPAVTLTSPQGEIRAEIRVGDDGHLGYSVQRGGEPVITSSRLGAIVDGVDLGAGVQLGNVEPYARDVTFPTRGVHALAHDRSRGLRIRVTHAASKITWTLDCRASADGFAFRYEIPGSGTRTIDGEATSFALPARSRCWYFERPNDWKLKTYAGIWRSAPVEEMLQVSPTGPVQGPPLVFELPGDAGFAAVSEAALFDYSGMRLRAIGAGTFQANFTEADGFQLDGPIRTPWRVVLVAPNLNGLVNADLIASLCPAPDATLFADTSYIRPGRCVWRWWAHDTGTPAEERRYVDAAAKLGFEYSLVDEGWKEWPDAWGDLTGLCAYAAERRVGIWVWCHWQDVNDPANDYAALAAYLERVAKTGAVGVKIDFMNGEDLARVDRKSVV